MDLEEHVEQVNALLRKAADVHESSESDDGGDGGKWNGIEEAREIDREEEYMDEDRHTTVTVEAVDVTREGLQKVVDENAESLESDHNQRQANGEPPESETGKNQNKPKRKWTKERPGGPKKKKKKFKYESKAERKVTRHKERSGNKAKAKARKE